MHEALLGKRLFVCGLVTDFCVVDTCINARAAGFTEVFLIPDASRAVHIHGIGQHGTGFTTDPKEVIERAATAGVKFTSVNRLLPQGQAQAALFPPPTFPASIGPFGLLPAHVDCTLEEDLNGGSGTYMIKTAIKSFEDIRPSKVNGNATRGTCSPRAPLPVGWPGAPPEAEQICWAYPVAGISKLDALGALGFVNISASAEQCFFAYGGFLLIDSRSAVVAVQAVGIGDDLAFGKPQALREEFTKCLDSEDRVRPVTFPPLLRGGARQFCWIAPGEHLTLGTQVWMPSKTGAFLYMRADGESPIFFRLVLTPSLAVRARNAAINCMVALGGAVGLTRLGLCIPPQAGYHGDNGSSGSFTQGSRQRGHARQVTSTQWEAEEHLSA